MNKTEARKLGQQARRDLSPKTREEKSVKIFELLMPELQKAERIACYISIREEVETKKIIEYCWKNDKEIYVPKTVAKTLEFYRIDSWNDVREGSFHVLEPITDTKINVEQIDLMLVPLSAFDANNQRCGYGRGYYDSILNNCQKTIGLGYMEQQVDQIETDTWDVALDVIVSA